MKKPKAEKLPSGNYRARMQVGKHRYSATAKTKQEAQDLVLKKYLGQIEKEKEDKIVVMTVGKAMDRYISEKTGALSPSTIQGYPQELSSGHYDR